VTEPKLTELFRTP